ncbi:MAG: ATP-dependent zinc metalloprotease FtsH [Solobacterium sp.]|nr:ATP-dependent zinc metalloprotease FtsH [Erysipelotrichaceae bacterium]MCI6700486.1 ATP-dependent zinc metalloprotease FtsH [Solobacterium sp.]MDD5843192.1 ATP-dependent zinc metalloprotease FtsH [Solobacterium sp.]MDD6121739.1 ATP-dependent zinc metalloprotease FtsH [Solobacterium sp.]MDD6497971.1 ATP-dependent zinc metalloprotease FtsH [Solobacterium sp.]
MEKKPNNNNKRNPLNYVPYIIVSLFIIMMFFTNPMSGTTKALDYSTFMNKVNAGEIVSASVTVDQNTLSVSGTCLDGENKIAYTATVPNTDYQTDTLMETLKSKGVKASVSDADASSIFTALLTTVLPLVLFMGVGLFFINRMQGASGNKQAFDFSKSRARLEDNIKVRFADVAGCDEEKEEMAEIIDYLKSPRKFAAMGARIPKGILLSGSPGTGKTLLAKAVAGEANVPFYSISGSDFVEMFVGVGASRVRDMFAKAKKTAPCMIFIDEIDAVGRQRGAGMGGGHDEREQTLNQLLVEMDGMSDNSGIVVIAATNRPDVLDPALLRPGRFDRQITVSLPDLNGRKAILAVHARNKKLADDVDLEALARRTPGFSGADLENVLNEAAILTVRENKQIIGLSELDEAIDRVMMGPAKKSRTYDEHTKKLVAYHEAGHAIVGLNLPDGAIVQKITIIPRGSAGGYNLITPRKEKILNSRKELIDTITSYMGGRTAEEVFFDDITTGASNDIQQATRIAKDMVKVYGMSELGPIQYDSGEQSIFLGRDYNSPSNASSQVAYEIDQAVRQIIDECHETARKIILEHKSDLVKIAEALIANETITAEEIQDILNDKLVVRDGKLVKAEEVETITDINEPEVVDVEVKPKRTRKKKVTEEKGDNDKAA